MRIFELAEVHARPVMPHSPSAGILSVASLHAYATVAVGDPAARVLRRVRPAARADRRAVRGADRAGRRPDPADRSAGPRAGAGRERRGARCGWTPRLPDRSGAEDAARPDRVELPSLVHDLASGHDHVPDPGRWQLRILERGAVDDRRRDRRRPGPRRRPPRSGHGRSGRPDRPEPRSPSGRRVRAAPARPRGRSARGTAGSTRTTAGAAGRRSTARRDPSPGRRSRSRSADGRARRAGRPRIARGRPSRPGCRCGRSARAPSRSGSIDQASATASTVSPSASSSPGSDDATSISSQPKNRLVRQSVTDRPPLVRAAEARHDRGGSAGLGPLGQQLRQVGAARDVRVDVDGDIDAVGLRPLDPLERAAAPCPSCAARRPRGARPAAGSRSGARSSSASSTASSRWSL